MRRIESRRKRIEDACTGSVYRRGTVVHLKGWQTLSSTPRVLQLRLVLAAAVTLAVYTYFRLNPALLGGVVDGLFSVTHV